MRAPKKRQFFVLCISLAALIGLTVWLRLELKVQYDDNDRYSVINHATAVNFLCIDGYDALVESAHSSDILPALAAALEEPTEATVDEALREMARARHGHGLGHGLPGADWVLSVAVDPGLSKRLFRTASIPVLTPIFEAHYNAEPQEYESGDFNYFIKHAASKEWAVRVGHLERQLESADASVYHGDSDFPFQQGCLNMTNETFFKFDDYAATFVNDTFQLLNRPMPHSDLWPLTKAPQSVIVEPTYVPSSGMLNAFGDRAFPTLGWPVLVEVHLLFGRTYVTVVRGVDGAVRFWIMRNGTSSVSTGLRMNLTADETMFLDEKVPLYLRGGKGGGNMLFHSERLAQSLGTPVIRADWLVFGAGGPRIHQLRYFWDHKRRSVNAGVGPRIGDLMAKELMDGFETRVQVLENVTTPRSSGHTIDWPHCLSAVGCYQLAGRPLDAPYCGCPQHMSDCERPANGGRQRAVEL